MERKPFQITTDPDFLWLGEKHREALAVLRYGLMDNKGFLLLTGDVGTGKTTLINALVNNLGDEVIAATILDPGLEKSDFFHYIAKAFHLRQEYTSKGEFITILSKFLHEMHDQKKKVLLIIDEAQRLNQQLLEEIRLLSNIEKQSTKLINIFFVGQIEFNRIILDPKNKALRQRITVNYDLQPLTEKETKQYVKHRLTVAGAQTKIFSTSSIKDIYKFSEGYPRLINVICDYALVTGFSKEANRIGSKIIKECAQEFQLKDTSTSKKAADIRSIKTPETTQSKTTHKPARSYLERILFFLLAILIVAWIGIAIYFYLPVNVMQYDAHDAKEAPAQQENRKMQSLVNSKDNAHTATALSDAPDQNLSTVDQDKATADLETSSASRLLVDASTTIRVDFNESNEVTAKGIQALDSLVRTMALHRELDVIVNGYSESYGSYRYNKKMSEFTANIVKGYLVGKGIDPERIETKGMPQTDASDAESSKPKNRPTRQWVEIQFQRK